MGKRKKSSRQPQGPKKSDPLPTTFTCLFCNHENSVTVKLDKKAGVGQLDCRTCGQKFQCAVNCRLQTPYLSAAVDVYGEWVDAADAVAQEDTGGRPGYSGSARTPTSRRTTTNRAAGGDDDDGERQQYEGEGIVGDDEAF
ncbi:Transcription elongation factor-like protein [Hapsidospora chrysogenum ATCC 11550]|uniref:Transcription elongation factor 1 homolog n=1 Tax=Hapsidospora chrysogenum (strain ATCC 11550 / CBS 779.69 / DSM 880 / IAM 14645 / JCM 23072 / IMI 49137) TaxID=857340 RepID=A0A086TA89_HAPC1|nr:Transcription elongation factor-like protein [Hapsidospora chrysogenum ATCC 11550]